MLFRGVLKLKKPTWRNERNSSPSFARHVGFQKFVRLLEIKRIKGGIRNSLERHFTRAENKYTRHAHV